jgi:hypothetical protein
LLILAYLEDRLAGKTVTPPVEYLAKFVLDPAKVSADQIFKLETTLTFSRNSHLVAGELATDAGVASAATQLAPYTGPLTADPQKPLPKRSLTEFATNFAAAFAAPSGGGFRIATGADRDVFTGGGKSPLWVVQLGGDAAGQPISYTITDPGNPSIFAPRPISNVLKSKPDTPIIDYKTGSVISLDSTAVPKQFLSIDLDKWLGLTLGYIDDLLTPRYVSPAEILRKRLRVVMPGKEFPDACRTSSTRRRRSPRASAHFRVSRTITLRRGLASPPLTRPPKIRKRSRRFTRRLASSLFRSCCASSRPRPIW